MWLDYTQGVRLGVGVFAVDEQQPLLIMGAGELRGLDATLVVHDTEAEALQAFRILNEQAQTRCTGIAPWRSPFMLMPSSG